MSVKIRVSRIGKTHRPYWRVVVVDSRKKRDGEYLADLGTYDPLKHEVLQFDTQKLNEWVAKGAICSDAVKKIVKIVADTVKK